MRQATIRNLTRPSVHAIKVQYCDSFWSKFRGLMLKRLLPKNTGILLVEKKDSIINTSIHMLFMLIDIAVIWIDSENKVVDKKIARKWNPSYVPCQPARYVLEIAIDQFESFQINDHVSIEIE